MTSAKGRSVKMTATPFTRALGFLAFAAVAVMALLGLVVSPPDVVQGEAVRMLYLHVPAIWIAYGSFAVTSVSTLRYARRSPRRLGLQYSAARDPPCEKSIERSLPTSL